MADLTEQEQAQLHDHIGKLDAALEFLPPGSRIPYDIATAGMVLEEGDPNFIDVRERINTDMGIFGMVWEAENNWFTTEPYDEKRIFSSEVQCTVPWEVLLHENNRDWWQRIGEIQLHMQMAETPPGYVFRFYLPLK